MVYFSPAEVRSRSLFQHLGKLNDLLSADDGYIFLWSISEGTPVQKLSPKQGPIVVLKWLNCPHISQTSYFLVSGGADGTLKLWKKSDKQVIILFSLSYFPSLLWPQIEPFLLCKHAQCWRHRYWRYRIGGKSPCCRRERKAIIVVSRREPKRYFRQLLFWTVFLESYKEVFRHISTEPQMKEPAFPALARTVHFINSGRSIMVAFLDAKEM